MQTKWVMVQPAKAWLGQSGFLASVSLALWDRDTFGSGLGDGGGLRPSGYSGSGYPLTWGPCHLKSLGNRYLDDF